MNLPSEYSEWPQEAKDRYQAVKKLAASVRDYRDITDAEALRINAVIHKAVELDPGDGTFFAKAGNVIKKVFLTQTFH